MWRGSIGCISFLQQHKHRGHQCSIFFCIRSTCNAFLHILNHTTTVYLQAALTSDAFLRAKCDYWPTEVPAILNPTCSIALWPHRPLSVVSTVDASSDNSHPSASSASSPSRGSGWYHQEWCSPPLFLQHECCFLARFSSLWNVTSTNQPHEQ